MDALPNRCILILPRRLVEAEDRLDAAAAAAAAAEALRTRQANALQASESTAAQARIRVGELEATLEQQTLLLQARAQKEGQLEESLKQLQQVLHVAAAVLLSSNSAFSERARQ